MVISAGVRCSMTKHLFFMSLKSRSHGNRQSSLKAESSPLKVNPLKCCIYEVGDMSLHVLVDGRSRFTLGLRVFMLRESMKVVLGNI
jgi:hypothetical protein